MRCISKLKGTLPIGRCKVSICVMMKDFTTFYTTNIFIFFKIFFYKKNYFSLFLYRLKENARKDLNGRKGVCKQNRDTNEPVLFINSQFSFECTETCIYARRNFNPNNRH